jgi:hypothetical protein
MKKLIANFALLVCGLFLFILISEGLLRLFYGLLSNYNTEMWRYASDLKEPLANSKLPFHHFPNKEGSYYGVTIKTNAYGMREP